MPVVDAQTLQRSHGTRTVLDRVDLTIRSGERVGLLGDNGTGKSTLGRILGGVEAADGGEVRVRRGARVVYLAQAPDLDPRLSARDAVLSGCPAWQDARRRHESASALLESAAAPRERQLAAQAAAAADLERHGGWDLTHRADAMLGHLGVAAPERPIGTLSGGEQRRVDLARVLLPVPDLVILDEPTNHLDVSTIEWLERYLADVFTGAVLLITHDRYVLDRVAERTLELAAGQLYSHAGGYQAYLEGKAEREAHAARVAQNRSNLLRRELAWLRRAPSARGTKQKARVERAQTALAATRSGSSQAGSLSLSMGEARSGKTVIELRDVWLQRGERVLVRDLSLCLTKGERMGIIGPNGSGKTTLLQAVLGEQPCVSGAVVLGKQVQAAYLSQGREGLDLSASVLANVAGDRRVILYGGRELDARAYLQRFLFDGVMQRQPVASLSGGERTRVALARLLCHDANLVILDEPTNDLDVSTLSALEDMLLDFGGSALIVSHDRYFLDRVATSMLVSEGGGTWIRYAGNYTDYLAQRPPVKAAPAAGPSGQGGRAKRSRGKPKAGLTYGEQLELAELPARIDRTEQEVTDLSTQLADPGLYRGGGDRIAELQAQLAAARATAEALYARWEQLEQKGDPSPNGPLPAS